MCFDKNIDENRDDKFFEWDYWSLHTALTKETYFNQKKIMFGILRWKNLILFNLIVALCKAPLKTEFQVLIQNT